MPDLPDSVFEIDGDRAVPTALARGPWSPHAQHGGAPAALMARAAERCDPGPADFVARLTIDLLRPVPLAPLEVRARTTRPGKKVQWVEVVLVADDVEIVRATALRIRTADLELPVPETAPPDFLLPEASPGFEIDFASDARFSGPVPLGFWNAVEVRQARRLVDRVGPGHHVVPTACPRGGR